MCFTLGTNLKLSNRSLGHLHVPYFILGKCTQHSPFSFPVRPYRRQSISASCIICIYLTLHYDDINNTKHSPFFSPQAIEKFSANTSHIGQTLRSLCQRLAEVEFPNDVPSTEGLIEEHEQEWKEVSSSLFFQMQ